MLEFARHYGQRAHQTQRSGPVPGSMPSLVEVDEMIKQEERIHMSLARIREVIVNQQQAALAEQAQGIHYKATNGYDVEDSNSHYDDTKGGFAGADPKKRRGVRTRWSPLYNRLVELTLPSASGPSRPMP